MSLTFPLAISGSKPSSSVVVKDIVVMWEEVMGKVGIKSIDLNFDFAFFLCGIKRNMKKIYIFHQEAA